MTAPTTPDLGREISVAARRAGLRQPAFASLDAVAHRRAQLWAVVFFVCVSLGISVVLLSMPTDDTELREQLIGLPGFRAGVLLLLVGFAGYVLEKERYLRRLQSLLVEERLGREREAARAAVLVEADRLKSEFVSRVDLELSRALVSALDAARTATVSAPSADPLLVTVQDRIVRATSQLRQLVSEHDESLVALARTSTVGAGRPPAT